MILQKGGVASLRSFLEAWHGHRAPPIFAVNEQGQDLLNRKVSPEILAQANAMINSHPGEVRRVKANDGQSYLLFVLFDKDYRLNKPSSFALANSPSAKSSHPNPQPPSPIIPISAGIFASLIFSGLLAWYFAKPIRHLRSAFAAVAQGNLNTRAASQMGNRRDELADLGKNFDHMVDQIQMLMDAQQRLLHDVSHELRSPLARMQAAIGLAHQQPEKINATLERIERESQRMSDLVGELLTLSRLEAGVFGNFEDIDISELLADIVEDARFEADAKNVIIAFAEPEAIIVKGINELIHRALENVLRNAVQHTKPASTVTIETTFDNTDRYVHIIIADQGNGVAETELSTIFEPFFRGSGAKKAHSIGLGLTIALKAIEVHKGKIIAVNRPEGGLSVELIIPNG
ncbi:MAG: ATP-binding protein, partial [Methylococcaceae bacterium]